VLTEFGRTIQSAVTSCADELQDLVPPWSDAQRHDVERCLCVHLVAMHGRGMRDCARMLRLDSGLPMDLRNRLADRIDEAILARREFVQP
jgi:hypothetical protein